MRAEGLTAIVPTFNEEANLPRCLASLAGWVPRIVVVDSGSTDGTEAKARAGGAQVVVHHFETYTRQWMWALDTLDLDGEWVLGLDADQVVTEALRDDIVARLADGAPGVDGFYVLRRYVFRGRMLCHGGQYPKYLLKLFRRKAVVLDPGELLDHHFYVRGSTARLRGEMVEENRKEGDLAFWVAKQVQHAALRAREELTWRRGRAWPLRPALLGTPDQRVLWLRRLWVRSPLYVRPFALFFCRYVLQRGFLDGPQGLVFHLGMALWFPLLVDLALGEARAARRAGR
jgi:glycosyltransferase involved in cell wall biosynthesis